MNLQRYVLVPLLLLAAQAAPAQQSTLIIHVDAPCSLTVNGAAQGQLAGGAVKAVPVGGGDQIVECTAANGQTIQKVLQVEPGMQKVVQLSPGAAVRFRDNGNTTITDSQTGTV